MIVIREVRFQVNIQLFRERLSEKMCMRQPRKVIWDMINTLFLTTVAVEPTFVPLALTNICPWPLVPFFQISLENRADKKPPTVRFGIVACTFSDNLSRNSCICMLTNATTKSNTIDVCMYKGIEVKIV